MFWDTIALIGLGVIIILPIAVFMFDRWGFHGEDQDKPY